MFSSQDRSSLRGLKAPPLWLCLVYVTAGMALAVVGLVGDTVSDRLLCLAGGALMALGIQKLLLRKPLGVAEKFIRARGRLKARITERTDSSRADRPLERHYQ